MLVNASQVRVQRVQLHYHTGDNVVTDVITRHICCDGLHRQASACSFSSQLMAAGKVGETDL